MRLDKPRTVLLSRVGDDYESADWLAEQLESEWPGLGYTAPVVTAYLEELVGSGMIDVYRFDKAKNAYVSAGLEPGQSLDQLWFYISDHGSRTLRANWDPAWEKEWEKRRDELPEERLDT